MRTALLLVIATSLAAQETVTVYRDALGLAHVYADTDEALLYGLGRIHFRDRPVRTMVNLTRAAGRMLETVGQFDTQKSLTDDEHYHNDRRAIRYLREKHGRYLVQHYQRTGATPEDQELIKLLKAFVKGINDERKARPANLSSYLVGYASGLPADMRLSAQQYDALFQRQVEDWEPLALITMTARGLWENTIEKHGNAKSATLSRLLPAGSNSWAVPPGGSHSGHCFIFSDSHQPAEWYVAKRFKARRGKIDGGGFTLSGFPFIITGWGKDVSWAITLNPNHDPLDFYIHDGDVSQSPGSYIAADGSRQALTEITNTLRYRLTPGGAVSTMTVTDRYLDAAGDRPVTAVQSGRGEYPHRIYSARFSLGNPVPPTPNDPGTDPFRLWYRMLTATSADDAVSRALGQTLSSTGINLTIGDSTLAVTTPADRIPNRKHETAFAEDWINYGLTRQASGQDDDWVIRNGRLYHPITDFPIARSDGSTPVRNNKPLAFWANCNNAPIWLLGLGIPMGEPGSSVPYDNEFANLANPFDPKTYLTKYATGVLAINHFGAPWGNHTVRQEWVTSWLKALASETAGGITEPQQIDMMTNTRGALPIYLESRGFFSDLVKAAPAGPVRNLAQALKEFARRRAPFALSPPQDALDAARFEIFWELFRNELQGPWGRAWKRPFEWEFFMPRENPDVMSATLKALGLTHGVYVRNPGLDLGRLKRYDIPFGGPNVPVAGAKESILTTGRDWDNEPWKSGVPLMKQAGGRMPMLMRMRKGTETHHKVMVLCAGHGGRVNTLPEWTATNGPDFHAAPKRWASGQVYQIPMTEAALAALGYDSQVTLTFTY